MSCRQSKVSTRSKCAFRGRSSAGVSWIWTLSSPWVRTRASWQAWWEGSKPANRERGKALGQRLERDTAAAAHVGDTGAGLELVDHPVEPRQQPRHEGGAHPRPERTGGRVRARGTERVVRQADAGAERVGHAVDHRRSERLAERTGREPLAALLVGEHGRGRVGELEALAVGVGDEELGRTVGPQPLPHQPLGEPGPLGQLGRGQRPGALHGLVEAELVPEVDEQRHLLAHLVVPHLRARRRRCRRSRVRPSGEGRPSRPLTGSLARFGPCG